MVSLYNVITNEINERAIKKSNMMMSDDEVAICYLIDRMTALVRMVDESESNLSYLFDVYRREILDNHPNSVYSGIQRNLKEMQDFLYDFYEEENEDQK